MTEGVETAGEERLPKSKYRIAVIPKQKQTPEETENYVKENIIPRQISVGVLGKRLHRDGKHP